MKDIEIVLLTISVITSIVIGFVSIYLTYSSAKKQEKLSENSFLPVCSIRLRAPNGVIEILVINVGLGPMLNLKVFYEDKAGNQYLSPKKILFDDMPKTASWWGINGIDLELNGDIKFFVYSNKRATEEEYKTGRAKILETLGSFTVVAEYEDMFGKNHIKRKPLTFFSNKFEIEKNKEDNTTNLPKETLPMNTHLPIGKFLSPHGAEGMVKIQPWCDSVDIICSLKQLYVLDIPPSPVGAGSTRPTDKGKFTPLTIRRTFPHKSHACVKIDGIDTIEDAKKLHGITVYALRADLDIPDGNYFIVDLLGTPVIDKNSGKIYGKLAGVNTATRNHIYEIATDNGIVMLPAVEEFVADINPGVGIYVTPIEGFFEGD